MMPMIMMWVPWIVMSHAAAALMYGRIKTAGGLLLAAAVLGFLF
jgi:hypothetical protein